MITPDLNCAERGEMGRNELTIEQRKTAHPHPRDQMRERNL
jgi:hypothetical protein